MADKDNKAADEPKVESKADEPEKQEQAEVAYYYDSSANPNNAFYPGVPPGDILRDKYDELPKWIQKSIAESPMYSEQRPGSRAKKESEK